MNKNLALTEKEHLKEVKALFKNHGFTLKELCISQELVAMAHGIGETPTEFVDWFIQNIGSHEPDSTGGRDVITV